MPIWKVVYRYDGRDVVHASLPSKAAADRVAATLEGRGWPAWVEQSDTQNRPTSILQNADALSYIRESERNER